MADLQSKAFAEILDLVCEGEIEGLVNGAKSVYFDGTPLQNADDSFNFENVRVETRYGTQAQSYIAGSDGVQSETNVNVEVKATAPIVRTISDTNINAVRVTVSVPALYKAQDDGDQKGTAVQLAVDVQTAGGGYVTRLRDTIDGKATSKYQRSYRVELSGTGPWDIRVRRITADSDNLKLQNKTYWDSYTSIVDAKLRYPNSALVAVRFDASTFSGIPGRAYDMKLLKVKVPSNYNPTTRAYTGTWDGTFTTAWTDNPAWCFYDLVTNSRYGLGGYIDASQVDKWALYSISQYCDELVSDGFGGQEPRFTCNLYLQSRAEAYKVVQDLASCFRSMAFWASGSLTLSQDAPSDPVALFTNANVMDGMFSYSGSSAKARHTVALVTWNDPADQYKQKVEYVEDQDAIARFGVVPTEIAAIGCTSRGQAHRVGRWLLYSERYESEVVSFQTGIEGAVVRPGQVIKVADASRAGVRLGGRVHSATTTAITLDAPVTLGASTWTIYAMLPDGSVASSAVSGATGATVNLTTALPAAPQAGAQWIMSTSAVEAQTFRVLTVTEQDGGRLEVSALRYDAQKYDAVENNLVLQPRDYTALDEPPATPSGGLITQYLYPTLTDLKIGATITWSQVDRATSYQVVYKVDSGNPVTTTVTSNSLELLDAPVGTYDITVYAVSAALVKSAPYKFQGTLLGKAAPPADVTGIQLAVQGGTGLLSWDAHPDFDVKIGGRIVVRHSTSSNPNWNTSVPIAEYPGNATTGAVPLVSGTYLAKAVDSSGNYSVNTDSVITTAPDVINFNAVAVTTQNPGYTGAKTDLVVAGGWLQLGQTYFWDDIANLDAFTDPIDTGIKKSGTYYFDTPLDTGAVYTSRVTLDMDVLSYSVENFVDGWTSIDALGDIDGIFPGDTATVAVYISTTQDDPASAGATWSDWRKFVVGDYTARGFKFYVYIERGDSPAQQVAIKSLSVTVDVPDRVEGKNNVAVSAAPMAVTFDRPFFATPAIAVTAENMATGDYVVITGKSRTGFTVEFKNSAGTSVARTMDWIAKGYGFANI